MIVFHGEFMKRRTVTIEKHLDRAIQKFRGVILAKYGIELSYTQVINALAVRGLFDMLGASREEKDLAMLRTLTNEELEIEALIDQALENAAKVLVKLIEKDKSEVV